MTSPTRKKRRTRRATSPPPVADEPNQGPESFLDASAFPHLIDLILSFAPLDVVPTLRLTCRHIRNRVDDLFPRQIAFEKDGTVSTKNHEGKWVNGTAFHPSFVRIVDYRNTPVERTTEDPTEFLCKCAPDSNLHHRIDHIARVAPQLTRVRMVRQLYDVCRDGAALPTEEVDICVVIVDQQSPPLAENHYIASLVGRCKKSVVNIRYPFKRSVLPGLTAPAYRSDRAVIMFTPTPRIRPSSLCRARAIAAARGNPDKRPTFTQLGDAVFWNIEQKGCDHVQIVGIENWGSLFRPMWSFWQSSTRQAEFLADFAYPGLGYRPLGADRYAAQVSFPPFGEYRTEVGDKLFAFEMGETES